jgi:hypothetical protein
MPNVTPSTEMTVITETKVLLGLRKRRAKKKLKGRRTG